MANAKERLGPMPMGPWATDSGRIGAAPTPAFPGMTAPSPRVVDATSGVPRVVPSAVNPAGIEGRTSALPPLPELTRIMAPNNAEYTREMTESGLRNVAARTTVPGKLGAGVAGAVGIGAGAVADVVKAPYNAIKPVVNGAGDFMRGLFGMDPYAPGKDEAAAPAAAKPAAPAAKPAVAPQVPLPAAPGGSGPMSGDISGRIPSSVPAPRAADADLRDAAAGYAVNYAYGGPSAYAQPAGQAPAPVVDSNPFHRFDMSNPWNQMFAAQWDAASKKNMQANAVAQASAAASLENASTNRQRANQEIPLEQMKMGSAQKIADKQGATSRDVADIGLKGTIYTADAHERAAQRAAEARAAQAAASSEGLPTLLTTPEGMIVRGGTNGVEVLDPKQVAAQTKVHAAARQLPHGAELKDSSGAVIGRVIVQDGRRYIQMADGSVEEVPDRIRGKVTSRVSASAANVE